MRNILITGGLGYLGGRIATYLQEVEPESNITLTARNKNKKLPEWAATFQILEMSLLDDESIANCLKNQSFDVIIHLAALNEIESMENPERASQINTLGVYKLLKAAVENNISNFIYISTFHVYGKTSLTEITEKTPTFPFHPYATSHRAAEDFVSFFSHYHGLKSTVFRLSNGYGAPMDTEVNRWTLLLNDICRQAVTKGEITLRSSGKQSRDFISLHDVSRAVHHAVELLCNNKKEIEGVFNLGGNCNMSILDVTKKVAELYQKKYAKSVKINVPNDDSGLPETKSADFNVSKLAATGFTLKGEMAVEIEKTFELCEKF